MEKSREKGLHRLIMVARVFVLCGLLALQGCAAWIKSDVTKLDMRLTAAADLNPDLAGRPSPVVIRIYELKTPALFENADFFSLYNYSEETLGVDLVKSEEMLLVPGQQIELKLALANETNYVAVLGAYRDLEISRWKYVMPMLARGKNAKNLILSGNGISEI